MIACRAEHVGSLLRLKADEDSAVAAAIALQERVGLHVITDGEQRRLSFQSPFAESVSGLGEWDLNAFLWGAWRGDPGVGERTIERPTQLGVVAKLERKRYVLEDEFRFLRGRTTRTPKIALPAPSLWVNFWSPERSRHVYPTLERFLADVVGIVRDDIARLVAAGATYIQLDAPHYALLLDPATRGFYEARGALAERLLEVDNAVMAGFPGVTFALHLCRGNQGGRWLASGGYEPIARAVFRRVRAARLLLEYDDARSGSFEPLKELPEDKHVVLGLISTKRAALEPIELLASRVREASRLVPLERLALSPQCGFASSVIAGPLTPADQERKLTLVVQAARRVWGEV
jgi:5-methyltetrahydropteroyltriglutamate--homocysteine methyltransferase